MVLDSKSTTVRKMVQKMSGVGLPQRCLRSHNTRTVLVSKENKMADPNCAPTSGKVSRRAHSRGSHYSDRNGLGSQTSVLPSDKVLGEIKSSKKVVSVGKRSTRTALKIYDYCETDPDIENRPEGAPKKKSQTEAVTAGKVERLSNSKHKRGTQTNLTIPLKRKIDSSYFFCGKKMNGGAKRENGSSATKVVKSEPKLKKSVLADASSTANKISVKSSVSKCATVVMKNAERKCPTSSESGSGDSSTKLAPSNSTSSKNLNLPKQSCSTPIAPRVPVASLGVSPIVVEAVVRCSMSSSQCDDVSKICEDVSNAFVNVSVDKQEEEVDCSNESAEAEELDDEVYYTEAHCDPLHLGLTSTPEKNPSSAAHCEYSPSKDSGMDDIVNVTLYDSPKKLSPIKMVDSPDSSLSDDDSCYWDDDFESPLPKTDDGTPVKNDVEETVIKSFKAYHTPHQFRRHLFKKKSRKTLQKKPKSKSPAEVKLDLWASVMNDHFEDIEGSELVIE